MSEYYKLYYIPLTRMYGGVPIEGDDNIASLKAEQPLDFTYQEYDRIIRQKIISGNLLTEPLQRKFLRLLVTNPAGKDILWIDNNACFSFEGMNRCMKPVSLLLMINEIEQKRSLYIREEYEIVSSKEKALELAWVYFKLDVGQLGRPDYKKDYRKYTVNVVEFHAAWDITFASPSYYPWYERKTYSLRILRADGRKIAGGWL